MSDVITDADKWDDQRIIDSLVVVCPYCNADVGQYCYFEGTQTSQRAHLQREQRAYGNGVHRLSRTTKAEARSTEEVARQMEQGIHDALWNMHNLREKMDPIVARVRANVLGVPVDVCSRCEGGLDMDVTKCPSCGMENPDVSRPNDCKGEPL